MVWLGVAATWTLSANMIEDLGAALGVVRSELRDEIEPQARKISAVELKLAELSGALDVLSGRKPPRAGPP